MQSLSLTLSKRLSSSTTTKSLFRISPNLVGHASSSTSSSPPPSPPSSAAAAGNGSSTQRRQISFYISDVLKQCRPYDGIGNATVKVPRHSTAGYATAATTVDGMKRVERDSGLRNVGPKTKREQLLKATAVVPLLVLYPNAYTLLLANLAIFWHTKAGIEEILADYVHHEMTRTYIQIAFKLFLIIAMKDVFLKFVFV